MSIEKENFTPPHNETSSAIPSDVADIQNEMKQHLLKTSTNDEMEAFLQKAPQNTTVKESTIIEERVLTYPEVAKSIGICAINQQVSLSDLDITEAQYTPTGELLILIATTPTVNGQYKEFSYKIKQARPDGKPNPKATTSIDVTYWEDDMPIGGDIIAEFINGEWIFS